MRELTTLHRSNDRSLIVALRAFFLLAALRASILASLGIIECRKIWQADLAVSSDPTKIRVVYSPQSNPLPVQADARLE